jgi:hypothetical protein
MIWSRSGTRTASWSAGCIAGGRRTALANDDPHARAVLGVLRHTRARRAWAAAVETLGIARVCVGRRPIRDRCSVLVVDGRAVDVVAGARTAPAATAGRGRSRRLVAVWARSRPMARQAPGARPAHACAGAGPSSPDGVSFHPAGHRVGCSSARRSGSTRCRRSSCKGPRSCPRGVIRTPPPPRHATVGLALLHGRRLDPRKGIDKAIAALAHLSRTRAPDRGGTAIPPRCRAGHTRAGVWASSRESGGCRDSRRASSRAYMTRPTCSSSIADGRPSGRRGARPHSARDDAVGCVLRGPRHSRHIITRVG